MNRASNMLSVAVFAIAIGAGVAPFADPAAAAPPVTRWVDNDTTAPAGPPECARAQFDTIQAAVDASSPGDVVRVCPGTYVENVMVLTDGVTVRSTDGAGVTTVQAPPTPSPNIAPLGYNHVFYIRALDVTVGQFTIVPAGVADPDIGVNVANEGRTGFRLVNSTIIGGRIGVNLGCASYGSHIGHNSLYRQTETVINVDTCEMRPFPGTRSNNIHHNFSCSETATASIALGQGSDLNHIHHNRVRSISVAGFANVVNGNTTDVPVVDNGVLTVLLGNTTDPALCP